MLCYKKAAVNIWSRACGMMERFENIPEDIPDIFASWKIALVKQANYTDLYTDPDAKTIYELLESSTMRTGPTGFWPDGKPHFFIVYDQPDSESRIWEWKLQFERHNPANHASREKVRALQRQRAIAPDDVDWGQFDLVVSIENAIPARITRQFPQTKWATFLEHHRMPQYLAYLRQPPPGYDFFFTQRYGPNPQNLCQGKHAIDISYGFKRAGDVMKLFPNVEKKPIVHVEDHQDLDLIRDKAADLGMDPSIFHKAQGSSCLEYLRALAESMVLFAPSSSRPLGGLANIDAAAASCILVGNRRDLWNPYLISPMMHCSELTVGLKLVNRIFHDPKFKLKLLNEQKRLFSTFVIKRCSSQISSSLQAS
ncbi:MAG: hypothetical protein VXV91_06205 [Verrucomicrobiota bacterium]|nr:hypothetical protein [Verrucomicrobiota bacterium]